VYAPPEHPDEDSQAIRDFNEVVLNDSRVESVTLPVRDGMSIVKRRNAASADDAVARGVHGANILQRLRLNSKVALITGARHCHALESMPCTLYLQGCAEGHFLCTLKRVHSHVAATMA
jgi:hypothetical protein